MSADYANDIRCGSLVRYNQRARDMEIKDLDLGEFYVAEIVPVTNRIQRELTDADAWAHLSNGDKFVSLALLECCPATDMLSEDDARK